MSPFEVVAGIVSKLIGVVVDLVRSSGLSADEQRALLVRIANDVDAAAVRVEATPVREV